MKTAIGFALIGWLVCSHAPAAVPASSGIALFEAIRSGDRDAVKALLKDGADLHARDGFGNTPLMAAALNADAGVLELLLKAGSEVNATNKEGATALMRAAAFEDKTRLLVASGAGVQARSALGNTPLLLAARKPGNAGTVKFLIDHGAEIRVVNVFGSTALMAAVAAEDADIVGLLLDRGADVNAKPNMDVDGFIFGGGRTPLMWAAFRGNQRLLALLLARGAQINEFTLVGGALAQAAWAGHTGAAAVLLEAGARVDQRDLIAHYTPLHWAAASERSDARLVELLLAHGADANAEGGQPVDNFLGAVRTPLQIARDRGETPLVHALIKAGARDVPLTGKARPVMPARSGPVSTGAASLAGALQLAIPPLQTSALDSPATFQRHASRQNCISCHQQQLPLAAMSVARKRRLPVPAASIQQQTQAVEGFMAMQREIDLQTVFHPEPGIEKGYSLLAYRLENQPPSAYTDSAMHQLSVSQHPDGFWPWNLPRPPIQSSAIAATALALQGIKHYAIPGRQREFDQCVQRARAWLAKAEPEANEERAYQLLGLAWAGEDSEKLVPIANALMREQRADGGWGQLAGLPSDAFATGHSLYALMEGGAVSAQHPAVERGVRFLLGSQLADGTWHVRRRAFPFQPPMESGFPHGADGWISAAATSWAVMALATAMDPTDMEPAQRALAGAKTPPGNAGVPPVNSDPRSGLRVADAPKDAKAGDGNRTSPLVEFSRDIRPLLERSCVACHSGERAKGGFQVVNRSALLQGGNRGEPAIVTLHADQSPLVRFVLDLVEDLEMPPLSRRDKFPALTRDETARLSAWIDQGAVWPEGVLLQAPAN
jgi:ankyrin repeat protein